jgi:two-component system, LytTR family, sensor histidine kinase AlgZ
MRTVTTSLVFDVCHVGVVLRAVLLVHAAVAIGLLFVVRTPLDWLSQLAFAANIALPAVLLWLISACLLKQVFALWPAAWQCLAAVILGGLSAGFGHAIMHWATWGHALQVEPFFWGAPVLAGMALSAVLFYGLYLRTQARSPLDSRARLAQLQSRIRPHFLFNTLNTAMALVRLDPVRAEQVLDDLSELFRAALHEHDEPVSLQTELDLAQRYLAIEQLRFGERLKINWQLDSAAAQAMVPSLLLQPLVENAVRHGVEPSAEGCVVRIETSVKRGQAIVCITNSVPAHGSQPGHGIALKNVRERLKLMHDVAVQFDAQLDGPYFCVRMVLPL